MRRLGEAMLDAALGTDGGEDVSDEAALGPLVMRDERHAIVGQPRVNPIRDGSDQGLQKA
jgi:hypothetical protein